MCEFSNARDLTFVVIAVYFLENIAIHLPLDAAALNGAYRQLFDGSTSALC